MLGGHQYAPGMSFRINESTTSGLEYAMSSLCYRKNLDAEQVSEGIALVEQIAAKWGPVVEAYPSWHPFVAAGNKDPYSPAMTPGERCGYKGIDHSVFFRNAFITCPYGGAEQVIQSVEEIQFPDYVSVECEPLNTVLYHPDATAILVTCDWRFDSEEDGTIPKRYAIGSMIEQEIRCWTQANFAETWETMRPHLLGVPCGSKTSLFVNHETGQAMKKVWDSMNHAGVFGLVRGK